MGADELPRNLHLAVAVEKEVALPDVLSEASLHSLILRALDIEEATGQWEVNLLFTTDDAIRELHRQFMNLDSPTDIMTFPFEPDPIPLAQAMAAGGDIVISVETAAAHARDAGWSVGEELQFLVLHGILHILGWDDGDVAQREKMLVRQTDILREWLGRAG